MEVYCKKCEQMKAEDSFTKSGAKRGECRTCVAKKNKDRRDRLRMLRAQNPWMCTRCDRPAVDGFKMCQRCIDTSRKQAEKWRKENHERSLELARLAREKDPERHREYSRKHYWKDPDAERAKRKKRHEPMREKLNAKRREYYHQRKKLERERYLDWVRRNPDYNKAYYATHREACIARMARWRAKQRFFSTLAMVGAVNEIAEESKDDKREIIGA